MPPLRELYAKHLEVDAVTSLSLNNISTEDYRTISQYFSLFDWSLKSSTVSGDTVKAVLEQNSRTLQVTYNIQTRKLSVVYPKYYYTEERKLDHSQIGVLPDIESAFGPLLPRVSNVLMRGPDKTETLNNGELAETYLNFTEADYNALSKYLLDSGCEVIKYFTNERVLTILLEKNGAPFQMLYDPDNRAVTVEYAAASHLEPGLIFTPTPAPTAKPTPKPTAKPTAKPTQKPASKATPKAVVAKTVKATPKPTAKANSSKLLSREDCIDLARFYFNLHVGSSSAITFTDASIDDQHCLVMFIYASGFSTKGIGILVDRKTGDIVQTQRFNP